MESAPKRRLSHKIYKAQARGGLSLSIPRKLKILLKRLPGKARRECAAAKIANQLCFRQGIEFLQGTLQIPTVFAIRTGRLL